ncbi:hypothetical protein ACFE04_030165 [Oxalis oulophora]
MHTHTGNRTAIAFLDVETPKPIGHDQRRPMLEYGSILVCRKKLVELDNYSSLVKPLNPNDFRSLDNPNGITRDALSFAPSFAEISDRVYDILHGRVWAGHNIENFDCLRIEEAFKEIDRPAPQAAGYLDTLHLLRKTFGKRAGDMKLASLASYFGLKHQSHRSLDDCRKNLEVLRHCATVLFLESNRPDIFSAHGRASPNATSGTHKIIED